MYNFIKSTLKRMGLRSVQYENICESYINYIQLEIRLSNTYYYLDLFYNDTQVFSGDLTKFSNKDVVTLGDIIKNKLIEIGDNYYYLNEYKGEYRKKCTSKDLDNLINQRFKGIINLLPKDGYGKFNLVLTKHYCNPIFTLLLYFTYKGAQLPAMVVTFYGGINVCYPVEVLSDEFEDEKIKLVETVKEVLSNAELYK